MTTSNSSVILLVFMQSILPFQSSLPAWSQTTQNPPSVKDSTMSTGSTTATVSYTIFPQLEGIELTPDQQVKLNRLAQETVRKIGSKLPPEKQQKFIDSIKEKKNLRSAIQDIGFDFSLMTQIRPIMESTKAEVTTILTPEQQEQFEKQSPQQSTRFSGGGDK